MHIRPLLTFFFFIFASFLSALLCLVPQPSPPPSLFLLPPWFFLQLVSVASAILPFYFPLTMPSIPQDYSANIVHASRHPSILRTIRRYHQHLTPAVYQRLAADPATPWRINCLRHHLFNSNSTYRDTIINMLGLQSAACGVVRRYWTYMSIGAEHPQFAHLYWMHLHLCLLRMLQLNVDQLLDISFLSDSSDSDSDL